MNTQADNTRQENKVIPKVEETSQKKEKRGGRAKGVPNKNTAEIKALAGKYAPEAFEELARLAKDAENENTRVSAIKEILDRAYGKSAQHVVQEDHDGNPVPESINERELARRVAFLLTSGASKTTQH